MIAGLLIAAVLVASSNEQANAYSSDWSSLDARPIPAWWQEAKFGIFVHWGPYSVPAYAPTESTGKWDGYAEWYQGRLLQTNAYFVAYHAKTYVNAPYEDFAAAFTADKFDPDAWAKLFKASGAKYAILTAKHHDGFALWPSAESPRYNSCVLGAKRDLVGDFHRAMKAEGLKSGFYYSLLEYANEKYPANLIRPRTVEPWTIGEWARRINLPQMRDLVETYRPDVLWTDGEWDFSAEEQLSHEFLAWLYNDSSVKDSIVVNDRWGSGEFRGYHGGHYTTEYATDPEAEGSVVHPWEECRGIGKSFGYNRFEIEKDYMSREACLETLVRVIAAGGNLLLNVGPRADGTIPEIMCDRLLFLGRWLETNGEAIYGTTRCAKGDARAKAQRIYFTQKGETVYVIVFGAPRGEIRLENFGSVSEVSELGASRPVAWRVDGAALVIMLVREVPSESAVVFKIR